jgi:hypothetical protein
MPIQWKILHDERLVLVTTRGVVELKDVENYLDAIVTEGAMPYAKLFDASDIEPRATDEDVMALGARMSAYAATMEAGGPLAFVVTTAVARAFVDRYLNLTRANRPSRIFSRAADARKWLDGLVR